MFLNSNVYILIIIFYFAVRQVKVNQRSRYIQEYKSPRCYIPNVIEINHPIPEKKISLRFFTTNGHGSHLGHVIWTIYINFGSPLSKGTTYKIWLWFVKQFLGKFTFNTCM